jgi:hypothetical protein
MLDSKIKKTLESLKQEAEEHDKKIKDFWMNYPQTLFLSDHTNVVVLRGRDIECCWTDNDENLIRTRSGKEFSLTRDSWLKVRFEDANYTSEN